MAPVLTSNPAFNMNSVPGKIIMRGTSKISLQDRFARLSSEIQRTQAMLYNNDTAVSAANKRLAQELGNRPEVVAALRNRRKPLAQRLGVRARLGVPIGFRQRGFQQRNGFSPMYRRNVGSAGQIAYFNNNVGIRRPRFGPKRFENGTGRFGASGGFGYGRGGVWKRYRGGFGPMNRGGFHRVAGVGGGGAGFQKERLSREELDRQLDEYMAKTKARLDDDLDEYMGDATM